MNALATNASNVEATLLWLIVIKFSHFTSYCISTMIIYLSLYALCIIGASYDSLNQLADSADTNKTFVELN